MRILVDVTHPAHVHFFRHPIAIWRQRGHEVLVTSRRKDIACELLTALGIDHLEIGPVGQGLGGLAVEFPIRTAKLWRRAARFLPDVMAAIGGIFVAHAGLLSRVPTVVFYDTENAHLQNALTYPFCDAVVTPRCYRGWVPRHKHVTYAGYHELSYTHPSRFTPEPAALSHYGLTPGEPYTVLRLVAWKAVHDLRDHGITDVEAVVRVLERYGRVLISAEAPLPPSLDSLRIRAEPQHIHHLLAFAGLFLGESATMASESAMLGTPAIFVSTSLRGYTTEQESQYGLTFNFHDPRSAQESAVSKAVELLESPDLAARWKAKRLAMLDDMIDVAAFVADVVEDRATRGRVLP